MADSPFMSKGRARQILRETLGQRLPFTAEHHQEAEWAKLRQENSTLDVLCRIGDTLRPKDFVRKIAVVDGMPTSVGREPGEDPARAYYANLPDD